MLMSGRDKLGQPINVQEVPSKIRLTFWVIKTAGWWVYRAVVLASCIGIVMCSYIGSPSTNQYNGISLVCFDVLTANNNDSLPNDPNTWWFARISRVVLNPTTFVQAFFWTVLTILGGDVNSVDSSQIGSSQTEMNIKIFKPYFCHHFILVHFSKCPTGRRWIWAI